MLSAVDQAELIEKRLSKTALLTAAGVYFLLALSLGSRPGTRPAPPLAPVIEAELVEKTEPPKLHETAAAPAQPVHREAEISRKESEGKTTQDLKKVFEGENETAKAPPTPPTHGPIVDFSPSPKLPTYLKDQVLKTSVLIEFLITADGKTEPTLLGSSGNEELDALAIATAKTWVFRPAEKDGKPTDARVRLRINFQVE